jgi:hypothetical protein
MESVVPVVHAYSQTHTLRSRIGYGNSGSGNFNTGFYNSGSGGYNTGFENSGTGSSCGFNRGNDQSGFLGLFFSLF